MSTIQLSLKVRFVIAVSLLLLVIVSLVVFNQNRPVPITIEVDQIEVEPVPSLVDENLFHSTTTIGLSVEGRPIVAHSFGRGDRAVLFVGGVHGGYEWNTVMLAEEVIAELVKNPDVVPDNLTVVVIPVLNPDGLAMVTKDGRFTDITAADVINWNANGRGRFNANQVDLNRNFDCKWSQRATWRSNNISAGSEPFSEPEASALRDLVLSNKPVAGIFWHSVANAVYGSECHEGLLRDTVTILNLYGKAANYSIVPTFDAYPVTGDVEGWLASIGIPAITVELETRNTSEWERNWAGVKAILEYLSSN